MHVIMIVFRFLSSTVELLCSRSDWQSEISFLWNVLVASLGFLLWKNCFLCLPEYLKTLSISSTGPLFTVVFFYEFGRKSQESWHQSGQELRMRESGCQGARAKPLTRALFCSDRGLLCVCVCMHLYISVYLCCQQTSSLTPTHPRCVWKHPAIRIKRCRRKDSLKRLSFLPNSSVCGCVNSFLLSCFTPFCISNQILCWRNTLLIRFLPVFLTELL